MPDEESFFEDKKNWSRRKFWIGMAGVGAIFLVLSFDLTIFGSNSVFGDLSASISETFDQVFGFENKEPIYELDLIADVESGFASEDELVIESGGESWVLDEKRFLNIASLPASSSGDEVSLDFSQENSKREEVLGGDEVYESDLEEGKQERGEKIFSECDFYSKSGLLRTIIFNEVAWMGTEESANNEWMELKNFSSQKISLAGWQLKNERGKIKIFFETGDEIEPDGFYILERTDDSSVSRVTADKIYSGALSNEEEWLRLFDASCNLIDEVNASWGWGKFGGENDSKKTLERNLNDFNWHTSVLKEGTPKSENSTPVLISGDAVYNLEDESGNKDEDAGAGSSSGQANQNEEQSLQPESESQDGVVLKTVFVTEIMVGSSVSNGDEFVELYNYGGEPVSLSGWTIKKKSSTGSESSLVAMSRLDGKVIAPGKYFLIAHEEGYSSSVFPDAWWPKSYNLAYTNNAVVVYSSDGGVVEEVNWVEIPKDSSYVRDNLAENSGFSVQNSPNPQNSGE